MLATIIGRQMDTSSAWCKAPDDEPLGKQVSRMLFELTGRMRAHLAAVADAVDLTPMQARALHHLADPCPMGEVATRLHCDRSNVTGIVDRLEERGLVERRQDPTDRRRRMLATTPAGDRVRQQMAELMVAGHPILAGLSVEQQAELRDLLATVLGASERSPSPEITAADMATADRLNP